VVERSVDFKVLANLANNEKLVRTVGGVANNNGAVMEVVVCSDYALDARKPHCAAITSAGSHLVGLERGADRMIYGHD
jgi:hypothetical protein